MANEKFDTMYEIDTRYHLCETDAKLTEDPEHFGTRRINVAICGVGRMGAIHLYNILREPRAIISYLVDADWNRLNYMSKKYFLKERGVKIMHTDDWAKVLADPQVEAVLVAMPTDKHEPYVRSALEANKHVLCEKPLAAKLEAVDSLVKLAASKKLKLICAFNRRYDPSFYKVAQQIQRGDIGAPRVIKTCSRDSPVPPFEYIRTSGGIYHDCFVHDLDAILWLANELPTEVHAYAHSHDPSYTQLDDYDTTVIVMKFDSGCMSVTDLARFGPSGYEQRVEVYGVKGVLKIDELIRAGWEKHSEVGQLRPSQCYSFASRYTEAYPNEITELFNHIEGNKTMHQIRPGYLQAVFKIVHSVETSQRSGKPVKITWTDEEIQAALVKSV